MKRSLTVCVHVMYICDFMGCVCIIVILWECLLKTCPTFCVLVHACTYCMYAVRFVCAHSDLK